MIKEQTPFLGHPWILIFDTVLSGVKNFQAHLLLNKNIKVSKAIIRKALASLPEFSTTITRKYKFKRRHYSVSASREIGEIDLAFLTIHIKIS